MNNLARSIHAVLLLKLVACAVESPPPLSDLRPPFNKAGHAGTVWSETNPWFPPNLSRTHQVPGGPDHAWLNLSEDPVTMWRQVAEIIVPYGLTGLQPSVGISAEGGLLWHRVCAQLLEGFAQADNGARVQVEVGTGGAGSNREACVQGLIQIVNLLDHPAAYRLDGRPVITLYSPRNLPPKGWLEVFRRVEAATRPVVWLMNASGFERTPDDWLQYLRVFDGITGYIPTGAPQAYLDQAAALMRRFPHKVFEGTVGQTYLVHFHYGGIVPDLTRNYRESWQRVLAANPDSVTLCNFFDIYENSRMFPSDQSEDILLRIAQFEISRWRSPAATGTATPDLYVANPITARIGAPVAFEVLGFPLTNGPANVEITLEICAPDGATLHRFAPRRITLDTLRVERFTLDSVPLAAQRALCPRLHHAWKGRNAASDLLPHTLLVPGLRPNMMYWARSMKRMLNVSRPGVWSLDGQGPGGTVLRADHGLVLLEGRMTSGITVSPPPVRQGGGWVRILRNNREIESFGNWDLTLSKPFWLPDPGRAMDAYAIELSNPRGARYRSPPVWVVSGDRDETVSLPILDATGGVRRIVIEASRIPCFLYPCDRDTGPLLLDVSGHDHHGYLGGQGYGGGHLGHTGYRHEHTPLKGVPPLEPGVSGAAPRFVIDADGQGCLQFDGTNFVMIQGGAAFPYASTCTLSVKPDGEGEQEILGAANGTIAIRLTADGRVEARRRGTAVRSAAPLPRGAWSRLAVVYDLSALTLFVNGRREASAPHAMPVFTPTETRGPGRGPSDDSPEMINAIVLGGGCDFPFIPRPAFKGRLRDIGLYARDFKLVNGVSAMP